MSTPSIMLNSGNQGIAIQEVVPEAIPAMSDGLTKTSLLVGRRRIRFQPQTGTTANPGGIVQFVLADSSSLLDLASATIGFNIRTSGTASTQTNPMALDDGVPWCRRMQVSLNGNLIEDIDHCHRLANMEMYAAADKNWYQSAGSFAGWWMLNPDLAAGDTAANIAGYNPAFGDFVGNTTQSLWHDAGQRHGSANGEDRVVPLSLLSGFFRTKQYLPLNLLGEMVLQFTLSSAEEAIFAKSSTSDGTYQLSDIFMECDVVQPHYMLQELMTRVASNEGENGIVIPFESAIVSQGQAVASAGQASIIVSRATNNLRRLLYSHQPTGGLSTRRFPSVSCFPSGGTNSFQVRVGSYYSPSQPANSLARIFSLLQTAYGEAVNEKPGLINRNLYALNTQAVDASVVTRNAYSDKFIAGISFDTYKNTGGTNTLDADGFSVLGQAGSQCVVQVNIPTISVSLTPTVSLHATRYLSLANGVLRVVGV